MLVAVVGGKLQGVEAAYLARKAGWKTLLIDKRQDVPAFGLCDRFVQVDVTRPGDTLRFLDGVDFILPALENDVALAALQRWSQATGVPLAFDAAAYAVSSSKRRSNALFADLKLPAPPLWPACGFPIIVKPDRESGSHGVRVLHTPQQLAAVLEQGHFREAPVVQQYLDGPSCSIEVIGTPGRYLPLQVTDLEMDAAFDCKRVIAPSSLPAPLIVAFQQMAVTLAGQLQLKGVMDVEAIVHNGRLHLLEIDARLPSQTPTAVYWSTGINLVALLGQLCTTGKLAAPDLSVVPRAVIYEHIRLTQSEIEISGEGIISRAGPLCLEPGFRGADEALTHFRPGSSVRVATLIFSEATAEAVLSKRAHTFERLRKEAGLFSVVDPEPQVNFPEAVDGPFPLPAGGAAPGGSGGGQK